ncbi:MAG TPA: amino acid adenylation domain-containing protein [Terriglobales bacterium]|nr:amino acid adenylation domain-containing protein [Terriglobales bacterium]
MASTSGLSEVKHSLLTRLLNSRVTAGESSTSIGPRPRPEAAPLSFSQEQVWLHSQIAGNIPLYNESITLHRQGQLDMGILERCLVEIMRRHEIWRTNFDLVNGKPVQIIHPAADHFPIPFHDICKFPPAEQQAQIKRLVTEDVRRPFDLSSGFLVRALLLRTEQDAYSLFVTFHQIVFDAVSAYRVFLPELVSLYEAFSSENASSLLREPNIQYADFAYWQRQQTSAASTHADYWRKQLTGELPLLQWPCDRPRPAVQTHRGEIERFSLPKHLIPEIRHASQQAGVSFYMTLLTGLVALLHRYTNQNDIVLGGFTAGRRRPELEDVAGYFVNPLPLRFDISGNPTFKELQMRVRETLLGALAHDEMPFPEIVKAVKQRPDPSRNPLFQIVLSQQPKPAYVSDDWVMATEEFSNGCSKVDLVIVVDDRGDSVFGPITYNPDLFDAGTIQRMIGHWQMLLANGSTHPEKRISELILLTEAERHQILVEWNSTYKDFSTDVCLHELVERQAQQTPDAIALIFRELRISYRELNERANRLAHYLSKLSAGPEVPVGVVMERSVDMVVALLAILKAGGAYLPLDIEFPQHRLAMLIEDSGVSLVLTQEHLLDRLSMCAARTVAIDTSRDEITREQASNPKKTAKPDNIAYAIYTSGSTGKPKGVLNVHAGIVNRLLWMQDAYQLTSDDRVLQKTPYTFDVSVWEFFWPLITGATLVVAEPGGHRDPQYLIELIQLESITTLHFVPSMLQIFLEARGVEDCTSLKRVICSGEALPIEVQKRFFERSNAELHNLYGPTEAAVDVTSWKCTTDWDGSTVPIGRPIANMKIHILDRNFQPVPIGVAGELHIGGVGLARGYLNRPELTAEKFIPDPFGIAPSDRLYKTGDLARYRADGTIEFLGRIDDQVKIHGIRVELGEIEAVLHNHKSVSKARVAVREDSPAIRSLVAYVVPEDRSKFSMTDVREYLAKLLPSYMIPMLVTLDELPVTSNGKLDRRALPPPQVAEQPAPAEIVSAPIEQKMAELWKEVLGLDTVSPFDNFLDVGGDSLSAVQLVTRLHKHFGVRIKTNELAFQSLRQLAASCAERLQCQ